MKILFALIIVGAAAAVAAAQEKIYITATPLAYDRLYFLSSPQRPIQKFIVRRESDRKLLKVVYSPQTAGLRGTPVAFVLPGSLNETTVWNLPIRSPVANWEKFHCEGFSNFSKDRKGTAHLIKETGDAVLMFKSTSFDGFIAFENLNAMECLIVDSKLPPDQIIR